ncbi:Carbamoyltransferase HypF [Pontiella desulfatans]|uniref:Carbamoyltransferase n=1 Tax=Pontiella desulfatans TaxID=2750659 RepID=A0A6C2TZ06_PONDE|nr:carbamoyltransferase HypF [Pontiella desulfatans]VGO12948.1 Carbamoyltransferase HypF [Pontiella desulfatans]
MTGLAIHITGIVQGVGFRPWVWQTANRLGLAGTVRNNFDGVHIELYGDPEPFLAALQSHPPPLARIDSITTREHRTPDCPSGFRIVESEIHGEALQRISPDIAICDDCRTELFEPMNRRHRYPFINCVNCGPRFTIIENLPYDRPQTSMRTFGMCPACNAEYTNPSDRRYHAQPIACPECGPRMEPDNWEEVWLESMEQGRIVAVKGIGGFHLACDALNTAAVSTLRKRKGREAKPFALMVPDLEWVKTICIVSPEEERLLRCRERPIVLLKMNDVGRASLPAQIAPGLDTLGVMLPYSPMHELMFDRFPHPVVMTSANYSAEPMIHTNAAARKKLADIADVFILHNRDIVNRCDDPVCAVHGNQTIVLRPGRGVAPVSMPCDSVPCILAYGADLKNTFALAHHGQATLHPYVGDLENPETQLVLEQAIQRELDCFRLKPDLVVHDLHPDYFSTQQAIAFAKKNKVPSVAVQHHHAHLVGAYAGKAIGFAFDGTGFGTDGTIWGGEVLLYDAENFERKFQLRPFALPGGDAAVKDPRRVADSLLLQLQDRPTFLSAQIKAGINCPMTSSMGRLFDAVSCMLGICEKPTFDGEAAMRLEAVADGSECGDLAFEIKDGQIDWRPMILDLLDELEKGVTPAVLAARFHNTLAEIVYCCGKQLAGKHGRLPWVFAGGVFQNRLLVERIKRIVGNEFELLFSTYPNDSGLAVGQAMIGARKWASK